MQRKNSEGTTTSIPRREQKEGVQETTTLTPMGNQGGPGGH